MKAPRMPTALTRPNCRMGWMPLTRFEEKPVAVVSVTKASAPTSPPSAPPIAPRMEGVRPSSAPATGAPSGGRSSQ